MSRASQLALERARQAIEVCACFNLRRVSRAVTQVYDEALAPLGLSSGQYHLLLAVRVLGETSLLQLADTVWTDRSVMSRTVRPLEDRGLIAIVSGRDRRTRRITLTAAGHRALLDGYPRWERAQERMARQLGPSQLARLLAVLDESLRQMQPKSRLRRSARSAKVSSPAPLVA